MSVRFGSLPGGLHCAALAVPTVMILLLSAPRTQATVIDFELAPLTCANSVTTQGFRFSEANNATLCVRDEITREVVNIYTGAFDKSITMQSVVFGTPFSLNSFELNEYLNLGTQLTITGFQFGGTQVTASASTDGVPGKQTVFLPNTFVNLDRVAFRTVSTRQYYLDSITINESFMPVSSVPIPGTLPLVLGALSTLAGLRRRKKA